MHRTGWPAPLRSAWIGPALTGWCLGTGLQLQQPVLWTAGLYACCMALGLLGSALAAMNTGASRRVRWPSAVHGLAVMACTAVCAFSLCGLRSAAFVQNGLLPELEGVDLRITGLVAAMPQRNEGGLRFRMAVASAARASDGIAVRLPPQLELHWYRGRIGFETAGGEPADELQSTPPDLRAGQRWQMTVRLKAPHGGRNPRGFDYELWLWEQAVQATGYVRAGPSDTPPGWLGDTWRRPVERARQAVRDAIYRRMAPPGLEGDEARTQQRRAGVVAALVVGDQNAIDRADWDVFRATGVAHLVSISGLHITMFAWLASALVGWLWRRSDVLGWQAGLRWPAPRVALVGGVGLAAAYAVFSGWGVPSQRTVWMLVTVGVLRWRGLRWPWPLVWLLACAVVLAIDPWALLQAGFWLSFVAVGVLFATDGGAQAAGIGLAGLRHRARAMLREQWTVTLALTPLTLLLFQQVSLVGLLANLVAIPWVTLVVTPLALLGLLAAPIWDMAGAAVGGLAWCLQGLAALPGATVSVAAASLGASIAGLAGAVLLVLRLPWGLRALGVPLLLPVLLWQSPRPAPGQFELLVADIGQGNAVLVRTADHSLVFDTGPRFGPDSDAGHLVLVPLLRALGERVDTVVVSHRDSDHSGGAQAVLEMQPQARLLTSIEAAHPLGRVRPIEPCLAGQRWAWDGVDFEILHPRAADYAANAKPNAISCVLRISNGAHAALLAGDIEKAQEARLAADEPRRLHADVLLVPHHGSRA
ncbi:DNA internalization-related competence protein ComEC/Rec2 [Rhodoferax koreense]|uniref:DNA internalization-related competence protein ComEC/Rec2 n=1 Tax=Rhodoferax koreensis TaxID=1842727 RepID=A0A1P8JV41_9BURK|nr:DNA internalization-related competence protein ComEC/Rec2 [Rhodoferax koreense]APW37613.1 DNA internalization-related competence protein ComEC/Rec2 [Rhodoferax koreense]